MTVLIVSESLLRELEQGVAFESLDVYYAKALVRPRFTKYTRPPKDSFEPRPTDTVTYKGGRITGSSAQFGGSSFQVVEDGVLQLRARLIDSAGPRSVPTFILIGGGVDGSSCVPSFGMLNPDCTCPVGSQRSTISMSSSEEFVMCFFTDS